MAFAFCSSLSSLVLLLPSTRRTPVEGSTDQSRRPCPTTANLTFAAMGKGFHVVGGPAGTSGTLQHRREAPTQGQLFN